MNADLEERLSRRFEVALADARRDYPNLPVGRASFGPTVPARGRRHLIAAVVSVAVVVVLAFGAAALLVRPAENVGPAPTSPGAGRTIPPTIDGQRVYTLEESDQWGDSATSFLLRAYVRWMPVNCPVPPATPATSAERDMLPDGCSSTHLVPSASGSTLAFYNFAPRTSDLLKPWLGGPEIVIRGHTHDAEAAQCPEATRNHCESVLFIEGVVWPAAQTAPASSPSATATIPAMIDGQRVYSLAEIGQPASTGASFLLRAYVRWVPISCPTTPPPPSTAAERDLLPDICGSTHLVPSASGSTLAFYNFAPRTSDLLKPWLGGPEIVIRGHTHDAEATQCSEAVRNRCESVLVIEAVVWPAARPTSPPVTSPSGRQPGDPAACGNPGYVGRTIARAALDA